MKKIIHLTFIVLLSSFSFTALSQDMTAMMKQQMQKDMAASCNDKAFLSCIGIAKKKCISATNKTLSDCEHLFPKSNAAMGNGAAFMAHGQCVESRMLKNAGISASKLDACDSMAGGGPATGAPPMNMTQGIAMLNQALQQHAQSVGTDDVTLPVYKNATVMSHFASGEMAQMFDDAEPLPALMLASPDSTGKVVRYYRKKLKGFKEYKVRGDILFMESGPKNFDFVKDMKTYATTPHVMIMPIENTPGAPHGSRSKIEIAYKK